MTRNRTPHSDAAVRQEGGSAVQMELFPVPRPSFRQRCLGHLLWLANQQPLPQDPEWFYRMKARVLERHGVRTGTVWQEITRPCWDCNGTGRRGECWKCGGSGVFARTYHRLQQWTLGGRQFLVPVESTPVRPPIVHIRGRVEHTEQGPSCLEAGLWLALLFDRGLLLECLRHGPYLWYDRSTIREDGFRPLLQFARLTVTVCRGVRWLRLWSTARCIICGRKLWPWTGNGRWYCNRLCDRRRAVELVDAEDDPPF